MINRFNLCPLLIAFAAVPAPGHAQTTDEQKTAAQEALRAGEIDDALSILKQLSSQSSQDADLLRRLATAYAAKDDLQEAQRVIDRALALAPNDHDIQLARANILLWQDNVAAAEAQIEIVAMVVPDYPGLATLRTALVNRRAENKISLTGVSISHLLSRATFKQGTSQTWSGWQAAVGFSTGRATGVTFLADREERLAADTRLSGRLDHRIKGGIVYLAGSITPNSDFRESWSVSVGAERQIFSGTVLLIDSRYASYRNSDVSVLQTGVRHSLGNDFLLTARAINLFGGGETYRIGGAVRIDYAPEQKPGYFASAASYPDVELDGTRQLRGAAVGAIVPLGDGVTFRATAEYENRRASYSRKAVTIGIGWRFGQTR